MKLKPREIRVFLSSTFVDMEAERNHLIKHVFPKIRTECFARQVGFTEIDLRWGITEEESKNGATVEICLKEIDRCRDFPPFFIGFIGERYGWIPRHEDLDAYWDELEAARKYLPDIGTEPVDSKSKYHSYNYESKYGNCIQAAIAQGISVTELEMELAVLAKGAAEKLQGNALFLLRDKTLTDSLYQREIGKVPDALDTRYYDPAGDKLAKLKERLRDSHFLGIDGYTSIEQFGQVIEKYLCDQINLHFPLVTTPDSHQLSNFAHATFRFQRLQNFVPRDDVRHALVTAIKQRRAAKDITPILISGPSGQGKSSILADLARHMESLPGYRVIDHYIGTDADDRLDAWVMRILRTLHPIISDQVHSIPKDPEERLNVLPTWLAIAANRQQCRYILILDALDQLDDGGKEIRALRYLHNGIDTTIIASAADETQALASAVALGFDIRTVPPLDNRLREYFIEEALARYRKRLPSELVRKIATTDQSSNPLYLMLALEKLRLEASHESLEVNVDDILALPNAEELFLQGFLLNGDNGRAEQPSLALEFMAFLATSRNGLTEHELAGILALPADPTSEETGLPMLPQVYLSRLLAIFQPFLLGKNGNRTPMHSLLAQAALDAYGKNKGCRKIADYFELEWLSSRNLDRVAIELPGQLWVLGEEEKLKAVITDPRIALRVCERNEYEFSRYWISAIKNTGESSHQAEILVRRLVEHQEKIQSDSATRRAELLCLADAFCRADEVNFSSRIYHNIVNQYFLSAPGPANILKDSLRGFIECFSKMVVSSTGTSLDEKKYNQLIEMGELAMKFMANLVNITTHDSCIDRAEVALLRSELRERIAYITDTTNEATKARTEDIADAIIILEDEDCIQSHSFHATKAKAFTMILAAQVESISISWDVPEIRNRMINQALEVSENFQEYVERHLLPSDQQRFLLFEQLQALYSQAAYSTPDAQESRNYWLAAAKFAVKTMNELGQSCFSGDQHDWRLFNAAETISLALEAGCSTDRNTMDLLLKITNPENLSDRVAIQIREISKEIHSRLQHFDIP